MGSEMCIRDRLRLGLTPERISVIPHGTKIIEVDREASRRRLGLPLDGKILLISKTTGFSWSGHALNITSFAHGNSAPYLMA